MGVLVAEMASTTGYIHAVQPGRTSNTMDGPMGKKSLPAKLKATS